MAERRTKAELDPTILEKVVTVLKLGAGRTVAAEQAGISDETLRQYIRIGAAAWRKREDALLEGRVADLSAREVLFADFYDRTRAAESHVKTYALGLIQKAGSGDWKAAAWLLERLYPETFGRRVDVKAEHSGTIRGAPADLSKLSDDELWELRRIQRKLSEEGKKKP